MTKTRTKEMFKDYVAKISLKYINQTKDEMLREVEKDKEVNKLHNIKVAIASSVTNSLIIPSPNTEEDVKYMEKLGFILYKDKNGKYHIDEDKAEKDSEAAPCIRRMRDLRKEAADVVMKKIKKAMANDENKVVIGSDIYDRPYRSRLKYFEVWLSPELERAGFKATLVDDDHYSISW
jgi:hypothetical protein